MSIRSKKRTLPAFVEIGGFIILIAGLVLCGAMVVWATVIPIPSITNFENRKVSQSTKIFDRTGNIVLYDVHGSMRRTAVPLADISPNIRNAAIAVEDATFYTNMGFRPLSFARAVIANVVAHRYAQGGSTITQQVVKNSLLTQDKTILRKIEEIILALRLTKVYSKDQILETYLNETPYGGTIYGIQEASQYYFGVDAKDLDLAQAAYLAALPQAPTYFSPYGNHRAALDTRKNFVLSRMLDNKVITQQQYVDASQEAVQFKSESEIGIKAPHFVFYIREYLEQKYGADAVENGGLRVYTTLDADLQQKAEDIIAAAAPQTQKDFNASNAGLVAIDPKTGQILAMVGSRGYFDDAIDGKVNVTLAMRQPGSAFKPFVYATAFEKGYTPSTVVFDLQTQFSTNCQPNDVANDTPPCYSPGNYDGNFKGPMTLRDALAQSQNVPAVKTLYLVGINDALKTAEDLGITSLVGADRYGLTLVLGGGEVNLLEMTGAYSVFANDGLKNPPTGILHVEDNTGKTLEQYTPQSTQVIDPQIARTVSDVLSDENARIPEFGANSPLNFPGADVADKTGTTNDSRDAWIIGYTPSITIGMWAGNNNNSPMVKKIAAFIVAPTWHQVMQYAIQKYPADPFPAPAPTTDTLPAPLTGNWNSNPSQGIHDILYWVNKSDPRNGNPDRSDGQIPYWDYAVSLWAQSSPEARATMQPISTPIAAPSIPFGISSPQNGTIIASFSPFTINAHHPHPENVRKVSYYLNNSLVGSSSNPPYTISVSTQSHGPAILKAVADTTTGLETTTITFTIQ